MIIEERRIIESQRIRNHKEDDSIIIMNNSQFERFYDYIDSNYHDEFEMRENEKNHNLKLFIDKSDSNNKIKILIQYQIHNDRDRDIKIKSQKRESDSHNFKLIYHRNKDDSLEFRIFESYKDENNKLKRIRLRNDKIKKIERDKEKMIKFFDSLFEEKKERKII